MAVDGSALVGLRGLACLHIMASIPFYTIITTRSKGRPPQTFNVFFRALPNCQISHVLSYFQAFHYVGHLTFGSVDLVGSLQLPTFFLLSGFCLSLGISTY